MHSPRSDEPIYWLLFGAGGMAVAMALPAVLVVLIVAGITSPDVSSGVLSFAHAKSILGCWIPAFPKDFEYIDYLKCKDYTCAYMVPDVFFLAPDLLDKVEDVFKQLKRFADFTNFTIDDFE